MPRAKTRFQRARREQVAQSVAIGSSQIILRVRERSVRTDLGRFCTNHGVQTSSLLGGTPIALRQPETTRRNSTKFDGYHRQLG